MKPEYIPQLKRLWQEAFGDTESFIDSFFTTAFSPARCRMLLSGDEVLAAAYWLDCSCEGRKLAYIYAVATAKEHRSKGYCHRLMAAIHDSLALQGYCGSILVPGSPGLAEFYRGMGYAFFGGKQEFSCTAGESAVALRSLCAEEYAHLRQQFLPAKAVLQENENLDFLQKHASFSEGNGFILTYSEENGKLWCPELLGDVSCAPGILRSLGLQEGRFRVPGETPFAMFRPLAETEAPGYFGFAFD